MPSNPKKKYEEKPEFDTPFFLENVGNRKRYIKFSNTQQVFVNKRVQCARQALVKKM